LEGQQTVVTAKSALQIQERPYSRESWFIYNPVVAYKQHSYLFTRQRHPTPSRHFGRQIMSNEPLEPIGFLAYLPRAIALLILAIISAFIVWSFHTVDWPAYLAALVIGGFFGLMVGGLVGVHLLPSLMAMLAFGGLFEGIFWGWSYYGWGGAILGGLIGLAAGPSVVLLPMMLIHFVLLLCGIDPLANLDPPREKQNRE
jgi:hypothetical protein